LADIHYPPHLMPRVLSLLDTAADFQATRSEQLLSHHLGLGFPIETRTIGPGGSYPNAAAALYRLRRLRDDFDLIHAWGNRALTLAAMATRLPLVYSPPPVASPRVRQWARAVLPYRRVEIVCPTSTLRRLHVERGIPLARTHLIRPGVDFSRVNRRRNTDLRQQLGFTDDTRVILAVGEHTQAAHHTAAIWATSILHVLDPRYRVLLWGRGPRAGYLVRFANNVHESALISVANHTLGRDVEFEDLLPAADVAMVTAKGLVSTLPISITMAAGLPIVSSVTYTTSELLEDRHTALMVPSPNPKKLAKRVTELYDNAQLQWSISDMARTEAYEYFPLTKFLSQYRTLYSQLAANQPIDLPEQAAGAGLRFHGRA
jgi:glycosyltransferase involved in cell wall biosynthesis